MDIQPVLQEIGISAFGIAMPLLAPSWTDQATASITVAPLSLQIAAGTWHAPLPVIVTRVSGFSGVTLIGPDGGPITAAGVLMTVMPGAWLRLSRLYAQVLETADASRPLRAEGVSVRPVPRYFFAAGTLEPSDVSGQLNAGDALDQGGTLTIHDPDGMPIDPLAVAAAFTAFMTAHQILQSRAIAATFVTNHQVKAIADLATASGTRVRIADLAGRPQDVTHLEGLTAPDAASGVHTLSGAVTVAAASDSFPADQRRLLVIGPATTGRLGESFTAPSLPAGITLQRDFFSLRAVELDKALLGAPPAAWTTQTREVAPTIRRNEPVTLLRDGHDVLAAAQVALTPAPLTESLAVAQAIQGDFDVPSQIGAGAHWPAFPALPGGAAPGTNLSVAIRQGITMTAQRFDDGVAATATVDVIVTLGGLPAHAAVRVYPRIFNADATESRGDGAGGVTDAGGALSLLLRDPFSMRRIGQTESGLSIPDGATLRVDLAVVTRGGGARLFGNVAAVIGPGSPTTTQPVPGANAFDGAARRGVCSAGILGLGRARPLPAGASAADTALAMLGEAQPRDASRFPTMARRELLAAGRDNAGAWEAVIAAGKLSPESMSADPRRGAPGGRGGRETQLVGVATGNGRLAVDIARAAFRRTTNVISRCVALLDDRWDEPAEPSAPAAGADATATTGTFAGAVLQTLSPACDTPELFLLKDQLSSIPGTWRELITWLKGQLPSGTPFRDRIDSELDTLAADDDDQRAYAELVRELSVSAYGRRDALWALSAAIERARHFIYIESPGFGPTARSALDTDTAALPAHAVELVATLRARLAAAPGLHVMIGVPREPAIGPGYEPLAAREILERRVSILGDAAAIPPKDGLEPLSVAPDESRVLAFHPIGFPGRPSAIEGTVVIVDDTWMLLGSSTFRRRGLTFDGGTDAVLVDAEVVAGGSPAIRRFRHRLMADRLGVRELATGSFGLVPDPSFVRLGDGREAFHLIRETLRAGGLGRIDRLYRGNPQSLPTDPGEAVSFRAASPEGQEVATQLDALAELLVIAGFAGGAAA